MTDAISFERLIAKLVAAPNAIESEMVKGLRESAEKVKATAEEKFGTYQPEYGPYNAWANLAASTIAQKEAAGAEDDDPLIGYGSSSDRTSVPLRKSLAIEVSAAHLMAQVGTNDPVGKWQEFGTSRGIPPRPFLQPALWQNEEWIKQRMKESVGRGLLGVLR